MTDNVVHIQDYEKRSRNPDAVTPRNPADADVIVLPVIRRLGRDAQIKAARELPSAFLPDDDFPFSFGSHP